MFLYKLIMVKKMIYLSIKALTGVETPIETLITIKALIVTSIKALIISPTLAYLEINLRLTLFKNNVLPDIAIPNETIIL